MFFAFPVTRCWSWRPLSTPRGFRLARAFVRRKLSSKSPFRGTNRGGVEAFRGSVYVGDPQAAYPVPWLPYCAVDEMVEVRWRDSALLPTPESRRISRPAAHPRTAPRCSTSSSAADRLEGGAHALDDNDTEALGRAADDEQGDRGGEA